MNNIELLILCYTYDIVILVDLPKVKYLFY